MASEKRDVLLSRVKGEYNGASRRQHGGEVGVNAGAGENGLPEDFLALMAVVDESLQCQRAALETQKSDFGSLGHAEKQHMPTISL